MKIKSILYKPNVFSQIRTSSFFISRTNVCSKHSQQASANLSYFPTQKFLNQNTKQMKQQLKMQTSVLCILQCCHCFLFAWICTSCGLRATSLWSSKIFYVQVGFSILAQRTGSYRIFLVMQLLRSQTHYQSIQCFLHPPMLTNFSSFCCAHLHKMFNLKSDIV